MHVHVTIMKPMIVRNHGRAICAGEHGTFLAYTISGGGEIRNTINDGSAAFNICLLAYLRILKNVSGAGC